MSDVKPNMEDQTDLPDYEEQELATTEVAPAAQKFVFFHALLWLFHFFLQTHAFFQLLHRDTHIAMHSTGWKDFMLNPQLFHAISDCGFEHPSEVQHAVIPQAILGTDIICQAKSGMGKTAVFVISVIQLDPEPKVCTRPSS